MHGLTAFDAFGSVDGWLECLVSPVRSDLMSVCDAECATCSTSDLDGDGEGMSDVWPECTCVVGCSVVSTSVELMCTSCGDVQWVLEYHRFRMERKIIRLDRMARVVLNMWRVVIWMVFGRMMLIPMVWMVYGSWMCRMLYGVCLRRMCRMRLIRMVRLVRIMCRLMVAFRGSVIGLMRRRLVRIGSLLNFDLLYDRLPWCRKGVAWLCNFTGVSGDWMVFLPSFRLLCACALHGLASADSMAGDSADCTDECVYSGELPWSYTSYEFCSFVVMVVCASGACVLCAYGAYGEEMDGCAMVYVSFAGEYVCCAVSIVPVLVARAE